MFGWNFDHSTWGRFHACVLWILNSYITQPTCWSLPYREAYSLRDTHHWRQKEYAHNKFRHTKPLSDPPKRRPWEEATRMPVCPCLTFRCVCTRSQGLHQRHSNIAKSKCGLSWWEDPKMFPRTSFSPKKNWRKKLKSDRFLEIHTGKIHMYFVTSVLYDITCITSNTEKPDTDSNHGLWVLIYMTNTVSTNISRQKKNWQTHEVPVEEQRRGLSSI